MEHIIHKPNDGFDFLKIEALTPTTMGGGNHFIKFRINESPIYIEPPKSKTKQGITKSGKKHCCELMFSNENETFIRWMENLETFCKKKLFEKRNIWFDTNLEEDDIDNSFTAPLKIYKSIQNYVLKTNVPTSISGGCSLKLYNENQEEINIETIGDTTNVVSILEIQGIKCSPRNFQLEIEVKQMMVLNPSKLFESCVFQKHDTAVAADASAAAATEPPAPTPLEEYPPVADAAENIPPEIDTAVADADTPPPPPEIMEIDIGLEEILPEESAVHLKKRNQVYYEMYKEARRRAKIARDLAISSYLEAKNIKNVHLLNDIEDSESDSDEEDEPGTI